MGNIGAACAIRVRDGSKSPSPATIDRFAGSEGATLRLCTSPAAPAALDNLADRSPIAAVLVADKLEAGSCLKPSSSRVFLKLDPLVGSKLIWIRHGMFTLSLSRHSFNLPLLVVSS